MSEYFINFKNQLKHFKDFFILVALCTFISVGVLVINKGHLNEQLFYSIVDGFLIIILLQLIPLVALHWNYYLTNKEDKFVIDDLKMSFYHRGVEITFSDEDVKEVMLHQSFASEKNFSGRLCFDDYHHVVITLNNETEIVLTSLMFSKKIELPVAKEKTDYLPNFYRWVNGESLRVPKRETEKHSV